MCKKKKKIQKNSWAENVIFKQVAYESKTGTFNIKKEKIKKYGRNALVTTFMIKEKPTIYKNVEDELLVLTKMNINKAAGIDGVVTNVSFKQLLK